MRHRTVRLFPLVVVAALLLAACGAGVATTPSAPQASQPRQNAGNTTDNRQMPAARPSPAAAASPEAAALPANPAAESVAAAPAAAAIEAGGAPVVAEGGSSTNWDTPPPRRPVKRPPHAPTEPPYDSTFYQNYGVNPFVDAWEDPLSTFAMDVDTASYGIMRRYVGDGFVPDPDSVRVEEYLNTFDYRYPQPDGGNTFTMYAEGAPSPFGGVGYELLQIGIQARDIPADDRAPVALTFVIDVSGSMAREDRLETVKDALAMLVDQMRSDDQIGIVVYGDYAESILPPTSGANRQRILDAIYRLQPGGSTNVEAGLDIGFAQASEALVRGNNMILLCSDGVANNGVTDPYALLRKYERYTSMGIKLATFGFGMGNYNDVLMEQLADAGDGFYHYIDSRAEAEKVFVSNLSGTLQIVARDAKIQVEFNPEVVSRYRLVGYENRDIADHDFRNDSVDAGEVGAGHSVTALYEITRYPDAQGDVATIRIRYQQPDSGAVIEEQRALATEELGRSFAEASPRLKLAATVAQYAELLRHSRWARGTTADTLVRHAYDVRQAWRDDPQVDEFVRLLEQATRIAPAE